MSNATENAFWSTFNGSVHAFRASPGDMNDALEDAQRNGIERWRMHLLEKAAEVLNDVTSNGARCGFCRYMLVKGEPPAEIAILFSDDPSTAKDKPHSIGLSLCEDCAQATPDEFTERVDAFMRDTFGLRPTTLH